MDEENGHVDWNRDGEFAPPGTTVKAQANFQPYGSCEGTRTNAQRVPDASSHVSPALDRLANRTYVFYSVLGLLRYQSSSSSWDCPEPLGEGQACGMWDVSGNAPINAFRGVDVARLGSTRDAELLVVGNNSKGELFEARLFIDSRGRETWTDAVRIPGTNEAVGEPALVRMTACLAYLAYKDTSGRIRLKTYTHDSGWGADEIATTPDGEELTMWRHASPGLGRAYLAWKLNAAALYGAFADEDGRLALYGYNPFAHQWEDAGVLEYVGRKVAGRPTLAWVPDSSDADLPGRLYLAYAQKDPDEDRTFRRERRILTLLQSYVKVTEHFDGTTTKEEKVGLMADFDNVWLFGFGIDFLYERGVDTNLRAAYALASSKPENWTTVRFRPVADGVVDYTYRDHDDWEALRVGVCKNVVNRAGLVGDPIECPASTWVLKRQKAAQQGVDEDDSDKRDLFRLQTEAEEAIGTVNAPVARARQAVGGALIGPIVVSVDPVVAVPVGLVCPEEAGTIDGGVFGGVFHQAALAK